MGALRVLLLVGFVAKFWWVIPAAIAAAVLLVGLWKFTGWLDRRLDAREARRAARAAELTAIARRADQQHAWTLAGDDRGIYGEYTPTRV
jgi:type II secretory pathway pseudopilin PulG